MTSDDTPRDPLTLLDAVNNPQIPDHAILKNTTLGEVRAALATRPSGDKALRAAAQAAVDAPGFTEWTASLNALRAALATQSSAPDVEGLTKTMRYHPMLRGKRGDYSDGWDDATTTLLDLLDSRS